MHFWRTTTQEDPGGGEQRENQLSHELTFVTRLHALSGSGQVDLQVPDFAARFSSGYGQRERDQLECEDQGRTDGLGYRVEFQPKGTVERNLVPLAYWNGTADLVLKLGATSIQ